MLQTPASEQLRADLKRSPSPTRYAALADLHCKLGQYGAARRVVTEGLVRFPGFVPALLVEARIALSSGDPGLLREALTEAHTADPEHPMVRELVLAHVPDLIGEAADSSRLAFAESDEVREFPVDEIMAGADLVTESLADLYRRQGHLESARQAYAELLVRNPGDGSLAERHAQVQEELAASRPRPYDSRIAGGVAVADWLARLADHRPAAPAARRASYDAFFEASPAPPAAKGDIDAFERWLGELDR